MRVCVLTPTFDSFKGGNHLPLLQAVPGIELTILTSKATLDGQLPKNVRLVTLNCRLGSYYYGFADARFAKEVLRQYPPGSAFWKDFDVIHLNQALHPSFLTLQKTGVPVLYVLHHTSSADVRLLKEELGFFRWLPWYLRYARIVRWQRLLCRRMPRSAGMPNIMTVSQTVKDTIVRDYGAESSHIHIVPNGVDGEEFRPSDDPPLHDVIAVGSFIHPRKGFRYLADVYRRLSNDGVRIADVGRRSAEQQAILRQIRGVTIHGTVPHDELVLLMRRAACLMSTSLYEGFGLSLIEALACGIPAFAFGCGAVPEVLRPVDPELIVGARDTQTLSAHIRDFLALPEEERRRRGRRYRERVLELYSLSRAAEALGRLYGRLRGRV